MLLRVVVDPPDEFDAWLKHESDKAAPPAVADVAAQTFLKQSCVNCHRVRGVADQGTYAPDLTHLMSRKTLASGMIDEHEGEPRRIGCMIRRKSSRPA